VENCGDVASCGEVECFQCSEGLWSSVCVDPGVPFGLITLSNFPRVLLERLIVNRPHPWGLLITFIELIKNPTYKFWNHEFVHCAPEIEK
jgi:hypothetical protein